MQNHGRKTSKEVIDYVDQNPGSIGVIGSNWLNDRRDSTNTTFKKNIHVMRVSIKMWQHHITAGNHIRHTCWMEDIRSSEHYMLL